MHDAEATTADERIVFADTALSVTLINHASVLIEDRSGIRLLSDPWFFGLCFDEGWGLRYENDAALDQAARATHVWISHFHDDHMHLPTLRALHERNPDIAFLANASFNFNIAAVAKRLGFKNVVEIEERKPLTLAPGFVVTRYPCTGIDNMLLIETANGRLLNYNDCNLSALSQKWLAKKLGRIDILLSNFNHAGKLLHTKPISDETVKRKLVDNFRGNYEHFSPSVILPFASHHYYRAPESAAQNSSMIAAADLVTLDPRIVPIEIGDRVDYRDGRAHRVPGQNREAQRTVIERKTSRSIDELTDAAKGYATKLRGGYGVFAHALPALDIEVTDLATVMRFKPGSGLTASPVGRHRVQIRAHSAALFTLLTKTYGTDAFAVGAHFTLGSGSRTRLVLLIAAGMLVENKLDMASLLKGLFKRDGRQFLINRREEIGGILLSGKIFADYHSE